MRVVEFLAVTREVGCDPGQDTAAGEPRHLELRPDEEAARGESGPWRQAAVEACDPLVAREQVRGDLEARARPGLQREPPRQVATAEVVIVPAQADVVPRF